jgi:hypothetical protein
MADEVRLPRFEDWKRSVGGSVGLWDYASKEGGATLAFAFASLFWPGLVEVEGCILLAQRFDETAFRQWRGQFGDDREAIERMMNHVHLWDLLIHRTRASPKTRLSRSRRSTPKPGKQPIAISSPTGSAEPS